ncbi:MAG: serine/threonine protein phosphatase, partial [Verrucomicrobiaceae bacterium]
MSPLTIAIADIHGRRDLLEIMLQKIAEYVGDRPHTIITLGDYVDRGPDSKGVLDILMN